MEKVIAVFGAGPGLGLGVARHYAQKGYRVALLARNPGNLAALERGLRADGYEAAAFQVDLADHESIMAAVGAVRAAYGRIDAIHYSPNGNGGFSPAQAIEPEAMLELLQVMFLGLVSVVQAVLPDFRKQGGGTILAGFGGSAAHPAPFLSGPGPAMAAARNYLYSLQGELKGENIEVGVITVSAIIRSSLFHQAVEGGHVKMDMPPGVVIPQVEPLHLATLLEETARDPDKVEVLFP
jgi:NAD(P)-dependent dehydrogenase (short-subunit alcohol dehydrogenase family)